MSFAVGSFVRVTRERVTVLAVVRAVDELV
jgi:hypothetical protein